MKDEYILYLDEREFKSSKTFAIAGIAVKKDDIPIIEQGIDEEHNGSHLIDDKYNIALQKVIENYTHYLSVNDGYGDVVYESRNNLGENSAKSPDVKACLR